MILASKEFPYLDIYSVTGRRFNLMALDAIQEANRVGLSGVSLSGVRFVKEDDDARQLSTVRIEADCIPGGVKGGAK